MTANYTDIATLQGREVYDRDGEKVGTVGQIYADRAGQPTWASVNTGWFGLRQSLVPLSGATNHGDGLQVPFEKATVKDAPHVDHEVDEPLTGDQVQELYRHYQLQWDAASTNDYAGGYTTGAEHTRDAFEGPTPDASREHHRAEERSGLRRYPAADREPVADADLPEDGERRRIV